MDTQELAGVPLFADLSEEDLRRVSMWMMEVSLPQGVHLLQQGSFAHEFFVILEGEVSVAKQGEQVATLGPGDFFGEIALIEDERRTADVVTSTPVRTGAMDARDFSEMCAALPVVADRLRAAAIDRGET